MAHKGITQLQLVEKSHLSKATVSRICNNSNSKGASYSPKREVVIAVSFALKLTVAETKALEDLVFPEVPIWYQYLESGKDIYEANIALYEIGCPLLGNQEE